MRCIILNQWIGLSVFFDVNSSYTNACVKFTCHKNNSHSVDKIEYHLTRMAKNISHDFYLQRVASLNVLVNNKGEYEIPIKSMCMYDSSYAYYVSRKKLCANLERKQSRTNKYIH